MRGGSERDQAVGGDGPARELQAQLLPRDDSTEEAEKTVFHYEKECKTCRIKNLMLPRHCKIWDTKSIKYQRLKDATLNTHAVSGGGGGGLFAEKFVCVDQNFDDTWNRLNEKPPDWLHHKYIDQMMRQEHKVLTDNYDPRGSIVCSWDYANRNQAKCVDGKCVEHSPAMFGVHGAVQPSRHQEHERRVAHLLAGEGLPGVERDGAE